MYWELLEEQHEHDVVMTESRKENNMIKAEWTNKDALDLQQTCNQLATDCISRQAAIDTLDVGAELLRRVLDDMDWFCADGKRRTDD